MSYLEDKQKDLAIHIQDMIECAQDIKACSDKKYSDMHSRILELESSVRRIVILSYQIKALRHQPPFDIED